MIAALVDTVRAVFYALAMACALILFAVAEFWWLFLTVLLVSYCAH